MKLTSEMIKKINEKVEELELEETYAYVGVRVQEVPFELGQIDHCSKVWVDGEETDEELDGVCATKLDKLTANEYFGDYVAILCGNSAEYGEDAGEIIISDAIVASIIC